MLACTSGSAGHVWPLLRQLRLHKVLLALASSAITFGLALSFAGNFGLPFLGVLPDIIRLGYAEFTS